jgi:transposase-like protein
MDGRRGSAGLAAHYAQLLAAQAGSGLSVTTFAEQAGVSAATLYSWRRRLRGRMTADDGLLDQEVVMRSAEEMGELLSRWESSGLTERAFAEQEGVPYSTLVYWRRRLKLDEERSAGPPEEPAFAPVP